MSKEAKKVYALLRQGEVHAASLQSRKVRDAEEREQVEAALDVAYFELDSRR